MFGLNLEEMLFLNNFMRQFNHERLTFVHIFYDYPELTMRPPRLVNVSITRIIMGRIILKNTLHNSCSGPGVEDKASHGI